MSGVYTNLAKKRIEQSQGASQTPPKSTEPENQDVDIKEHLQEGKSPLRAIVADQNATPPLSEPAQHDTSNIHAASVLASGHSFFQVLNFNGLPVQNAQFYRLFCVLIRLLSCWALQEAILESLYYKALRGSLKKLVITS